MLWVCVLIAIMNFTIDKELMLLITKSWRFVKLYNTGNETTDKLIGVDFSGNIIHTSWYKTVLKKNGKADIIAINILADIVYWYRPTEIRNESTGQLTGYKKKYNADLLQRTYESYADQLGLSKRQVQDAVKRLEELKIVRRVLRNITTDMGMFLANVLYFELNFSVLYLFSFPVITGAICTTRKEKREVPLKNVGRNTTNSVTYTDTTTKTSTKNTLNINPFLKKGIDGIVFSVIKRINKLGEDYGCNEFIHTKGKGFINVSQRIHEVMHGSVVDCKFNSIDDISEDNLVTMAGAYFETDFDDDITKTPFHFLSDGVVNVLYYQNCY